MPIISSFEQITISNHPLEILKFNLYKSYTPENSFDEIFDEEMAVFISSNDFYKRQIKKIDSTCMVVYTPEIRSLERSDSQARLPQ